MRQHASNEGSKLGIFMLDGQLLHIINISISNGFITQNENMKVR